MKDVLRIGHTHDQFLRLIDEALHEQETESAIARQNAVREGTWDTRAEWVSDLIEQALSCKSPSHSGRGPG